MYLHPRISHKLFVSFALGLCLLICGFYGAVSESDILVLAFYGLLIGGGLFLLVYSAILWRRAGETFDRAI